MFELDGEFDLDEDFLQGVFETENEVTKKIAGLETKGEKRSSPQEEPCISAKKYKLSSNDQINSQFQNRVPFESRSKVSVNNIDNNSTETYAELSNVHEVNNINLNASETGVHSIRNDRCKQSGVGMQLDGTCSTVSDNCPGRSTAAMFEPRVKMLLDGRYKNCGCNTFEESLKSDRTPRCCSSAGQTVRQRKFPGPAGLLPDKDQMMNQPTASMPITDSEILHNENPLCFQSSGSMFEGAAWVQMLRDFELSDNSGPLSQFTVAWVKRRAAARQLLHQKVPFLVTVLHDLDCSSPDPCVVLQDRTGEVHGTLHREVWEQYGGQLQPGSVLVLRQVGVLSTGVTGRRHYLNITCNNIINIYSNVVQEETGGQHSCEVRTTRVHPVTRAELLKGTSDLQALHSSPETSPDCRPVNSMFSTVGSPASLSVPCYSLNQSASPLSSHSNGWQQSVFSVPKVVCGTEVPQTSGRMLWNSVNSRNNTKSGNSLNDNVQIRKTNLQNVTGVQKSSNGRMSASTTVNISTPFDRRVIEATAQSVYGKCASSGHNLSDLPQQIKKDELSNNESLKFHPHMAHASGRRSVLNSVHQSDEEKTSGNIGFKFLPQPSLPFISDRTDMLAPKFKGGFTPKVSHFGSSSASASQASNPSQVPAIPSASYDVSDLNRISKPTGNVAKPLHQTSTPSASLKFGSGSAVSDARNLYSSSENVPRSSKCLTEVESSALEVLEGLDTSSLFDDF